MKYLLICYIFIPFFSISQQTLALEKIMAGNDFIGHQPNNIHWGPDNKSIYFSWKKQNDEFEKTYSISTKNKIIELTDQEAYTKPTKGYMSSTDKTAFYYQNGDKVFWYARGKTKLVYQSAVPYRLFKVINNKKIILKQGQSFFVFNHTDGTFRQCVNFDLNSKADNQSSNYLERQQIELFDYIKDDINYQKNNRLQDSIKASLSIPSFNIHKQSVGDFEIDSATSFIVFRTDTYPKNKRTQIEAQITESGYSESVPARPKVGADNPEHELNWMDLKTREYGKIEIENLPGIYNRPAYLKLYDETLDPVTKDPKAVIYTQIIMNAEGNASLVEIKSYDNKDRWIIIFNHATKKTICVDHQHDEAWIGGPGISGWNMVPGNIGWLKNGQSVFYQSEKTGYSHLYVYSLAKGERPALTEGQFEIYQAELSKNGDVFYITSNKTKPGNRGFYHLKIKSKKWVPILTNDGNYEVAISPNEDKLAIRYSYQNKPWELYIANNTASNELIKISSSTSTDFNAYKWRTPDIITFKNQLDKDVYARLFIPEKAVNNGAAIQFVHGAGYLQNAHNWWSGYYREYMFHNLLCDKGYTVIDIDYTASKGYGRDFRTGIYRHMGGQDLDDQIAGRKYLVETHNVDPKKVGIYGGSYGGFITIMALLKYPGYFQCGAAIRSVTDWAHYNHAYTSNILNTPDTDSIAFRQSSPIYFAENLVDELLILHGMMDNNVQMQDVVRLNQRFIELGKKNFTMALYPVEPHGFIKTSSWIDEYSRILNLFEKNLN